MQNTLLLHLKCVTRMQYFTVSLHIILTHLISVFFPPLMEVMAVGAVSPPKPFKHAGKFGLRRVKERLAGQYCGKCRGQAERIRKYGDKGVGGYKGKEEKLPFASNEGKRRSPVICGKQIIVTGANHRPRWSYLLWTKILPRG